MDILEQVLNLNSLRFLGFVFILSRLVGFFLNLPVFSHQNIPVLVKAGLVLLIALIILPFVSLERLSMPANNLEFFLGIIKEMLVGLVLGFCARLIFVGIHIAGQIIDYQMGFGFVNIVDPELRIQVPLIGQFLFILGILVFLLLGGHHLLIQSMVKSFQAIPLCGFSFKPLITEGLLNLFSSLFVFGFKIASAVLISLFLVDIAYSVIARAVPQTNILIIGFPLKIGLGIFFLLLSLPLLLMVMKKFFLASLANLDLLIRLI